MSTFTLSLHTDEINPFFFQLCDNLYYTSELEKLNEICELMLEFMIRYRIVQPSSGGGALSNMIRNIMRKIDSKGCKIEKSNIYKIISDNKNSDASRYPDNEEFILALKKNVTIKNARVLLYQFARRKGEEIKDFDNSITLEHLMPQTINEATEEGKWWINNLGGKDKWEEVYNKYLNSIGNMALITRKLNASISNASWNKKRKALAQKAMDKATQKVAESNVWTKKQIEKRNNSFSKEISKIITGPKKDKGMDTQWL